MNDINQLVHDVNSKCASLQDASKLLRDAPTAEYKELLGLMVRQARILADDLAAFESFHPAP